MLQDILLKLAKQSNNADSVKKFFFEFDDGYAYKSLQVAFLWNRCGIYKIIYHKFYFDEMYYTVVRQFIFGGVARVSRAFNDYVIEGLLAFSIWFIHKLGDLVRTAQAGYLPFYLGTLIVGVLIWRFFGQLPL